MICLTHFHQFLILATGFLAVSPQLPGRLIAKRLLYKMRSHFSAEAGLGLRMGCCHCPKDKACNGTMCVVRGNGVAE